MATGSKTKMLVAGLRRMVKRCAVWKNFARANKMKNATKKNLDSKEDVREKAQEHLSKAYRLQMSGHIDEAMEEYEKSIECYPTAEAYCFMGWAYSFKGDYYKAIELCEKAIDIDPDFGNSYNDMGAYYIQLGMLDIAIPYLQVATQAKKYATPHFPHYNLGRVYERQGKWFEAIAEYKTSLQYDADYRLAIDAYYRLQALMN